MKKFDKEIISASLKSEQEVLQELSENYAKALADVKSKIKVLMVEANETGLQSKIYQLRYQQSLEKQLSAIMQVLKESNFSTISEYLGKCYNDGFIGALYSLQCQGMPMVLPIDQNEMVAIINKQTSDFKLSQKLYSDVEKLQNTIKSEISRGIATNMSYAEIARNISNRGQANMNQAFRIARTEGHRVQNEAKMSACYAAKECGADIVKQWDATLDSKTRDTHRRLDGQIVELDEDFTIDGMSAPYPGGFGDPAEDCNCRCCLLQRARWAVEQVDQETGEVTLGEGQYQKWDNEHGGFIECSGFKDYEEKYLKILSESDIIKTKAANGVEVSSISIHTLQRAEQRGITATAIKTAFENPLHIGQVVTDELGRRSQRFIGDIATANVNPDSGKITTVWKTGKKTKKKYTKRKG